MRYLFLLGVLAFCQLAFAVEIHYSLRMAKPQSHYFQVEMAVKDLKQKSATVKLPVWAPGSYLVREFSKNLNQVKAVDGSGKSLNVVKVTKNGWEIELKGASTFVVKYEVYAFEQSVRTNFLDNTHGFVSGPAMFMYLDGAKEVGGTLDVIPFVTFKKVSTGLKSANTQLQKGNTFSFRFDSYDQLVDCPIEIGNQETFDFMAAGVKHTVAMYGEGNYNPEELKRDMAIIVEEETKVVGVNPNENYLFIVHNVIGGDGGLEHANSTVLSVDRWTYAGSEYLSFLNLVAHEYFHLWNVKRIRPIALGPFNYDQEVYTNLLWVMEGFTSYYDELILRRCGFYTEDVFLKKLQSSINYVEGSIGSRVQPVSHASFDAWIKAYRPNENSANTTMTYYSRGAVLGAVFDAMVIKHSKGKQCLDHVLKHLYETYHVGKKRGFTDAEFKEVLEKFTGQDLTDFYKKYIDGTEVIPYSTYFLPLGIEVSDIGGMKPVFGASVSYDGGKVMVKSVRTGSSAEDAGLSVNDEIISCMGYRVDKSMLEGIMNGLEIGEEAVLLVARDQIMQEVKVKITGTHKSQYIFKTQHDDKTLPLYTYWLR